MPIVRMPDGTQVKFPYDMPREQIRAMIEKKFPEVAQKETQPDTLDLPVPGTFEPQPLKSSYDDTYVAQGVSGINEGLANTLGMPVDLANVALGAGAAGINKLTGSDIQVSDAPFLGSESIKGMMGDAIRPESDDQGKKFLRRVGQEVGASVIPGAGVVAKSARPISSAATQGALALGSGAGGAVAQATNPDNPYLEVAGQILGGASVAGIKTLARKMVSPGTVSASRREAIDYLKSEGIDLTAGQKTGSRNLLAMESEIGGVKAQDFIEKQSEQFTRAALSKAGISGKRATPEVMNNAFDSIGEVFENVASRNTLTPDKNMVDDLANVYKDYTSSVGQSQVAPLVKNTITDIVSEIKQNGVVSGKFYANVRSSLGKRLKSADPQLKTAISGLRDSLDDAMERTLTRAGSSDMDVWKTARNDYKNMMAIEIAASRAGQASVSGLLTPASLRSAVAQQNKRAYVRGRGDLNKLSRAGVEVMPQLPDSGTGVRTSARVLHGGVPLMGAVLGGTTGDATAALAGATLGAAAPRVVGNTLLSRGARNYLANRVLQGPAILDEDLLAPLTSALSQHTSGN